MVRFGSAADHFAQFTLTSAFGGKADINSVEITKFRGQLTARSSHPVRLENSRRIVISLHYSPLISFSLQIDSIAVAVEPAGT